MSPLRSLRLSRPPTLSPPLPSLLRSPTPEPAAERRPEGRHEPSPARRRRRSRPLTLSLSPEPPAEPAADEPAADEPRCGASG